MPDDKTDPTLDVGEWTFGIYENDDGKWYATAFSPTSTGWCIVMGQICAPLRDTEAEAQADLALLKTAVADMLRVLNGGPSKAEMMDEAADVLRKMRLEGSWTHKNSRTGYCEGTAVDADRWLAAYDALEGGADGD